MTSATPNPATPPISSTDLSPNITAPPVYSGPHEVLVNQPVTLKGSYDATRISKITLAAEDKVKLDVTLSKGTWQLNMPRGFSVAGSRWLRLRGFDAKGKEVDNRVFYLTVSTDPLTVGQALSLKVLQDTYFKLTPQDSSKLNDQQKVMVRAGQILTVQRYGWLDSHLKLELGEGVGPIGNFGYFYADAVQLSKGNRVLRFTIDDVPNTPADGTQMLVTTTTFLKKTRSDSTGLSAAQKTQLIQGQTLQITGYACLGGHFRVTLAEPIAGFGDSGYIYYQHARLKRNNKEIFFDSEALTAQVLQTTVLKKRPVDSAQLKPTEKATVMAGKTYGVGSYGIEGGHVKIAATEEFTGFGNTGYLYPAYLQMRRGGRSFNPVPPQVEMNVPYFSQRDNPRLYWSTCNVTAIAMVMYYFGIRSKGGGQLEDELLQWCFNYAGYGSQTNHNVLVALNKAYGFAGSRFGTKFSWEQIKEELIGRRPVVLCGMFTHGGHIVTLVGYTPDGFIVNDPWGDGYYGYVSTEGRKLLYPYDYCNEMCGPDGQVWAHFIAKS
jgi:Peptidase_C39 like family